MGTMEFLNKFRFMFYAVTPGESSFEKIEDVPDYITDVIPAFVAFIVIEMLLFAYESERKTFSINDSIGSISQGLLQEMVKLVFRGVELSIYIWMYQNYCFLNLQWNSPLTWILCFIGVDLGYYWLHRASHEVNFLWAAHQVHHSSEYYNFSTALRQSVFQGYVTWMFYLPLAFAIPPQMFLVHQQFNTLYQFWIHNEIIKKLGPLEYILNTPSHHRVHHGRNRYCIDKNYAGTLIIWDRLFGTFEAESEEVVYGLTHPLESFNPVYVQLCSYIHIFKTFWSTEGFSNKISVLVKGPGWEPGKPRLGLPEDIPDVHAPMPRYNPILPFWCNTYILLHFSLVIMCYVEVAYRHCQFSQITFLLALGFLGFSLQCIGAIMDVKCYATWLELTRCVLYFFVDYYLLPLTMPAEISTARLTCIWFLRVIFTLSFILWTVQYAKSVKIKVHSKKAK